MGTDTTSLFGPKGFVAVRNAPSGDNCNFNQLVENKPYFPRLLVDPSDEASVITAAENFLKYHEGDESEATSGDARVVTITGGLTNALLRVDGLNAAGVLVRVFGSDGMIDRDVDTTIYAKLCALNGAVVHEKLTYLGRFGNGRVEGWIPNFRPANHLTDFGAKSDGLWKEVARQMARFHAGVIPLEDSSRNTDEKPLPSLWKVIASWLDELNQSFNHKSFQEDPSLLEHFREGKSIKDEMEWLQNLIRKYHTGAAVSFCHNDVNPGNILIPTELDDNCDLCDALFNNDTVCIIDFEYAAINYSMFDVANFFNEHCGGNDFGIPDYDLFPSLEKQRSFLAEYMSALLESNASFADEEKMEKLLSEVEIFVMGNHLYWGLWGLAQAAAEITSGTFQERKNVDETEWDNLRYGLNRLQRYHECKNQYLQTKNC